MNVNHLKVCQYDIIDTSEMLKMELLTSLPQKNELDQMDLMSENKQHELESVNLDYDAFTSMKRVNPKALRMEIRIKRKLFRSFIEIISPPGILVSVSWVSFYVFFRSKKDIILIERLMSYADNKL